MAATEIETTIAEALDRWVPSTEPLTEICVRAETQILMHLDDLVQRRVEVFAESRESQFRAPSRHRFYLDEQLYEIRITEDPTDATIVDLGVVATGAVHLPPKQRDPQELPLGGHGKYSSARLYVDASLEQIEDPLAADIQAHFNAGYRWLEAHVVGELLAVEYRAAIELYMELRSALSPELADLVALYGMSRQQAFYLLDPRAIQTAFVRATKNRLNIDASPIELTTMLVTQLLDPEETVSRASLVENRPLSLKLEESRYAATGLNLAEGMFYDTSHVTSFPLVHEGKVRLTAVFPADLQGQIAPELARLTDPCAEILRRHGKFFTARLYGKRQSGAGTPGVVAHLLGRFLGGFTESLG